MGSQLACSLGKRSFLSCASSERPNCRGASAAASSALVSLHVYDVGSTTLNDVLRPMGTGIFHCGVEVYFFEWAFCSVGDSVTGSGIFCAPPKEACNYDYRETVAMGHTAMSVAQVRSLIEYLQERWPADGYSTLRRNCCHFASELCQLLGVGDIPPWITHMAGAGASLDENARVLLRLMERGGPNFCCMLDEVGQNYEDLGPPLVVSVPTLAPSHCEKLTADRPAHQREGPVRTDMAEEYVSRL